jgi:LacI family transcriptional regulator
MEGVRDALTAQGLDASHVLSESWHPNSRELAQQLLKKQPRPTAFICNNRKRYDAVLHEASRLGLRVPYDVSICCFSGIQDVNEYPITAVVIPEAEMSKVGVDYLIDRIKTRKAPGMIPDVAPSFFRGETTLPPSSE